LFRRKPLEVVDSVIRLLMIASLKVDAGVKLATDRAARKRFLREVTLISIQGGLPIFPDSMSRIYVRSALGDVKRALKGVRGLRKALRRGSVGVYEAVMKPYLDRVEEALEGLVRGWSDLDADAIKHGIGEVAAMLACFKEEFRELLIS